MTGKAGICASILTSMKAANAKCLVYNMHVPIEINQEAQEPEQDFPTQIGDRGV